MGRKQTRARKYLYLSVASLIFISYSGCATSEKTIERIEVRTVLGKKKGQTKPPTLVPEKPMEKIEVHYPPPEKSKELTRSEEHLLQGQKLLAQGDYEGALRENQRALSLSAGKSPADEALFNMGLIFTHPGNPKKDYGKSLGFFKRLVKDYPQTPLLEQAKIWIGLLQENEKLNEVIEESKRVDIEIEEKRREKSK